MDYKKYNELWDTNLTEEQFNKAIVEFPSLKTSYYEQQLLGKRFNSRWSKHVS